MSYFEEFFGTLNAEGVRYVVVGGVAVVLHGYPRMTTDHGKFEIIYAGGAGAMQAFGRRIDQDAILEIIAFLDTLNQD